MNKKTYALAGLGLALSLAAAPLSAQAITKYVALGDSLTAGFQSGCLVQRNQVNSFPAVIARTLSIADFQQPLVQEVGVTDPPGTTCLFPAVVNGAITVTPQSQMGDPLNALLPRPYDNLGLPGFNAADLTEFKHSNPFGDSKNQIGALVLRNFPGSPFDGTSAVDQADLLLGPANPPTLVSLWIGNNDVLGAATSGIVVDGVTLTTAAAFEDAYHAILGGLQPPTRLVAANVPDVTAIPFTSTIPPVLVDPSTMQPVVIGGQPVPLLGEGDAAFPCAPTPPDQGCPLPQGTLVTLPASALLAGGLGIPVAAGGTGLPLPHGHIDASGPHTGVTLYPDEVALLRSRTDEYNATIASSISGAGGALWDTHSFFEQVRANGYTIGGITVTTTFVSGGIFSYDGVHPSNIGYTVIADQLIQTLNAQGPDVLPRPSFGSALFTPNVPQPVSGVNDGGAWHYSLATWKNVLSTLGVDAALPQAATSDRTPPRVARPTRTVGRPAAAE